MIQASEPTAFDLRISYPCYKSFDGFIDIEKLKSLDGYISEKIPQYIRARREEHFLNAYRLDSTSPYQPGAREIWLSKPKSEDGYDEFDKTELWKLTEDAKNFSRLLEFIETLPFKAKSRMLIIYDDAARPIPAHRDHLEIDICHEFIWFRTNLKKPLYMLNPETGEKLYVESHSAWFDTVNQFHGVDACDDLSFSIRVDGKFTDEFKAQVPESKFNRAATPALWACLS